MPPNADDCKARDTPKEEDLREPPELLRETWRRENLPDAPLAIPAIGESLLLERSGER